MAAPESTAGTMTNQATRVRHDDVDDSSLAVAPLLAGSIPLVLVAFICLCLYLRWARRRRREASSSAATASTSMPPSLDADTINGLPVTLYNPERPTGEKGSSSVDEREAECSICISTLVAGDKVKALPPCGHCFHPDCLDAWLRSQPSCPLCRTLLLPAGGKLVDAVN